MVNWKKFFVENDDNENKQSNNIDNNKDKRSKLQRWFEEDFNENTDDNQVEDSFDIEYFDENQNKYPLNQNKEKTSKSNFKKEDNYFEEDELNDNFEEDNNPKEKISFLAKFISLFSGKNKDSEDYSNEDFEAEDEPEDYKTYLERQKNMQETNKLNTSDNNQFEDDFDIEFTEDDDILSDNAPSKNKSFFTKIKDKLAKNKYNDNSDELLETDSLDEQSTDYEEEVTPEKKGLVSKLFKDSKDRKFDEINEDELLKNNSDIEDDKLEYYEDFEEISDEVEKEEQLNDTLQNTLKSLGIEVDTIKEVDIFSNNSSERRTHPTLAAVRVKRIIQDKKIEDLEKEVILEEDKNQLVDDIINHDINDLQEEKVEKDVRISKHIDERQKLNEDFNNLQRKEEKITTRNNLKYSANSVDKALDEIKAKELISSQDNKNYDIKIVENEKSKERRDKLKYTTVDDVLEGNEDLFENDVDTTAKKLNINRSEENNAVISEDIEKFREDTLKEKTSKDLIYDNENITELDNLILDTKIVEKADEEQLEEITKLEENLELIKKDNSYKNNATEEDIEISIEKVAKDSEIKYPEYDDLKESELVNKNILDGYSDYHLDLEEIEELTVQNEIESKSEKADIESLTKEIQPKQHKIFDNDIDKFKEEKTFTPKKKETENHTEDFKNIADLADNFEESKPEGIEYVEKLYTNEVNEFFVDDNAPLTFGEYKTQDRGYRPVSKETIENNKKKLEAIFEKYSNVNIPRKNTTTYVEQKLSADNSRKVGKFKPSPVYSSIYGAVDNTKNKKQTIKNNSTTKKPTGDKKNFFKEIADQEETVWNIDLGNRANKKK